MKPPKTMRTCPVCGAEIFIGFSEYGHVILDATPRRTPLQVGPRCPIVTVYAVHSEVCKPPEEESDE